MRAAVTTAITTMANDALSPVQRFLAAVDPVVAEEIRIPPRAERRAPVPRAFAKGALGDWIASLVGNDRTMWLNQALTLELIEMGENVVAATGTASGKTLPFMAACLNELLTGDGTNLVLYSQKGLASDQCNRWRAALADIGVAADLVGELNGDVPMAERNQVLERARILLATPDAVHAWLMRQVSSPAAQTFLRQLRFLVIDEAHSYEGVFGSNSAYLFRRLRAAANRAKANSRTPAPKLQLIAATATIADPAQHMERLSGCKFTVVGEHDNGAPFHGLSLLHIEGPAKGAASEKMVADIATKLSRQIGPDALIAFIDGRQGVERVALACDEGISPYRAGYEAEDRQRIEGALRSGTLRGVISTSALELGVDIPQFNYGFNLGIPPSRKALRQRIGRTGRASEAMFAVIAPPNAFAQTGGTFAEFFAGAIEPSPIYLENELIQFQQACCLYEECRVLDGSASLPAGIDWTLGFEKAFEMPQPAARRSREVERIAQMGTGNPHLDYSLRQICEVEYTLRLSGNETVRIGRIGIDKAMREAPPGANYIHCGRSYQVMGWRSSNYEHSILLRPSRNPMRTSAMIRTVVSISHDPGELINNRLLTSANGAFAEVCMRVAESVEGYSLGSKQFFYRELSQTDPRKSRKHREFSSTGVTIEIDEPWFAGSGDGPASVRRMVAEGLVAVLAREKSIAPSDIRRVHTGVAKIQKTGPRKLENAVVIFDNVLGGLRLTEWLFANFRHAIELLRRGVDRAGEDALVDLRTIERLETWYDGLSAGGASEQQVAAMACDAGERLIYAPGSTVGVRMHGALHERRLIEHSLTSVCGTEQLMYLYESGPGVSALVPHDLIELVGHDWRHLVWDPRDNSTKELSPTLA